MLEGASLLCSEKHARRSCEADLESADAETQSRRLAQIRNKARLFITSILLSLYCHFGYPLLSRQTHSIL
jgi:hypothetical protein